MAVKNPLALYSGKIKELQSGDTITGASGGGYTIVNQTLATYNVVVTSGKLVILCDTTSNNITINLNTAVGNNAVIDIKKTSSDSNIVTIDGSGVETIDGGLTAVIRVQYVGIELVSNNLNWMII